MSTVPEMSQSLRKYTRAVRMMCLEYISSQNLCTAEELMIKICKLTEQHCHLHPEQRNEIDPEYNIFIANFDPEQPNLHIELSRGITLGWYKNTKIVFTIRDPEHESTTRILEIGTTDQDPENNQEARITYLDSENTSFRVEYIDCTNAPYSIEFGMVERVNRSELYPFRTMLIRTNGVLQHRPIHDKYYFEFLDPFGHNHNTKQLFRELPKVMKEFDYALRTGSNEFLRNDLTTWNITRTRRAQNK